MTIYELIKKRNFYREKIKDIDNFLNLEYSYSVATIELLKKRKYSYVDEVKYLEVIINRAYTTLEVTIEGSKMSLGGLNFLLWSLKSKYEFLTTTLNKASDTVLPTFSVYFEERDELFKKYLKFKSIFTKVVVGVTLDDLIPYEPEKNNIMENNNAD